MVSALNERAFNLFTALLALILIVLTSILVTSMVQSESNTKTIIAKLMSQSKLESMSRLIRADAFQTFNYMMRDQIEGWLSGNEFLVGADYKTWDEWDKVIEEFTNVHFKNEKAFAGYLGENLPSQLITYNDEYAAGYKIEVDFNRKGFVEILQKLVVNSAATHDFFEVIDCDGTPEGCPNGSFYINLKFSKLDQKAYESMPLVTVTDIRSGRRLRDPVLPRNDLKVYIPLRLFRALAITRGFMHSELDPAKMNSRDDYGFYSPRFHTEIDSMALGFCDYGYCAPRKNPYFPPQEKYLTQKCPGYVGVSSYKVDDGEFRGESFSYNAGKKRNMRDNLRKLVKKRLCELSRDLLEPHNEPGEFEIVRSTFGGEDCYIKKENIEMDTTPAKKIELAPPGFIPSVNTGATYTIDDEPNHFEGLMPKCPFNYFLPEHRRIGIYKDGTEFKMPGDRYGAEPCEGFSVTEKGMWAGCTEVTVVSFVIVFEEKNLNYKVNKDREVKYSIATFNKGYTPFNPNYDFGSLHPDGSCALTQENPPRSCRKEGWICYVPLSGEGCYPP